MTAEEREALTRIEALVVEVQGRLGETRDRLVNLAERLERTGTLWAAHKVRGIAADIAD